MTALTETQVQQEEARLETEYAYRHACRQVGRFWTLMRHTGEYITLLPQWKEWKTCQSLQRGKLEFLGYLPARIDQISQRENLAGALLAYEELAARQGNPVEVGDGGQIHQRGN